MIKQFDFDKIEELKKLITIYNLQNKKILVAVSGGVDSVVLAHLLKRVTGNISLAYVHHGRSQKPSVQDYRDQAQKFVSDLAVKLEIPFFTNSATQLNTNDSEESLRKHRNQTLYQIATEQNFDVIAKAHHRDDLLETRLIRLIRGVGPEGLVAMQAYDAETKNFRPLLSWSKEDILTYAQKHNLKHVTDPSNQDESYLRNWLRNNWLQSLERYRAGSRSSLTKSLENLAELSLSNDPILEQTIDERGILKNKLLVLKKSEQRRILAHYLRQKRVEGYTTTQIDEILKRLDKSQKELRFNVAGCEWQVDAWYISTLN